VNEGRALLTLLLFAIGMVGGIVVHQFVDRGPAENPYVSLPKTEEPAVAHDVVAALATDDARTLSKLLTQEQLQALGSALEPIVDVRSTKFVGAVESDGRYLSAYVVKGKNTSGNDYIVGFVLRVANDTVVGVN
jgi:hypothetical protein